MALKIDDLDQLDPAAVTQAQAELVQLMQEAHPEVELSRGVVHDLLLYFGGVFGAVGQANADRLRRSSSLLAMSQDPTLADDDLVDAVLSNYGLTRQEGVAATGQTTIVVDSNIPITIPSGQIFTGNGQTFAADAAYVARTVGSTLTSDNDRELKALGDGTYAFSIDVTAVDVGAAGNIKRGTKLVPSALPNRFVTAYAESDFLGGFDTELNAELLAKQQTGIATKAWSNRVNIEALIREQVEFTRLLDVSIVGFGDPEMLRDRHWIWPTSGGGRTDLYARLANLPQSITLTKEATLVETTADGGIWQFSLARNEIPGFYEVERIVLLDAPEENIGYEVTYDLRSADITGDGYIPDIVTGSEAVYSPYQSAVIRFLDTDTDTTTLTVGSAKQNYSVSGAAMTLLAELQDFCGGRAVRNVAGDILIYAPTPCFLSLSFDLRLAQGVATPNTDAIANDLANYVNTLGFPGQLHASELADVIHNRLSERSAVGAIDMHGRIRKPAGDMRYIRSGSILKVPDDPDERVSGRTVCFFLDPRNVGITVKVEGFAEI